MIKSLHIGNFKAFTEPIEIQDLNGRNLVICGENGSGKTSFFEALKMIFLHNDMLSRYIPSTAVGITRQQYEQQFKSDYSSKQASMNFSIKINRFNYDKFPARNNAFFISYHDIQTSKDVSFDDPQKLCFPQDLLTDFRSILKDHSFINDINDTLKKSFYEEVEIYYKQKSDVSYGIKNASRNLKFDEKIDTFFNESIVHIIKLVILLKLIKKVTPKKRDRILVLDDIFSSLDAENRALIVKYIVEHFKGYQKIILTHNVGFFNLCHYMVNLYDEEKRWEWKSLYVVSSGTQIYDANLKGSTSEINNLVKRSNTKGEDLSKLGNDIRKEFEHVVMEYCRYLPFGNYHELRYIIDEILGKKYDNVYLAKNTSGKVENVYTLLSEIKKQMADPHIDDAHLRNVLQKTLKKYDSKNAAKQIIPILQDLKMFNKLLLNPMSHRIGSHSTFTHKEMKSVLMLMEEFQKIISGIKGKNNTGVIYDV